MTSEFDVICFSHLRWDFVYQRPQHLMSRFARSGRVFFVEEPVEGKGSSFIDVSPRGDNIFVCTPHTSDRDEMAGLIGRTVSEQDLGNYVAWFYTPMMLDWASRLDPTAVVYDCMDQLSAFRGAPPEILEQEKRLFGRADLVFTGGQSLYEAKRHQHAAVYAFPSSIDVSHFARAREIDTDVSEQAGIPHPRIGFAGVIDERSDLALLAAIADLRPEWSFVMVGPVVKIDEAELPRRSNIYYLGQKDYDELPAILAGWDAAMMPFALNESTRYISPTKTPEFLAAGLSVVSTPITDVVRPYGDKNLVRIAATPADFIDAIELGMKEDAASPRERADSFLSNISWDKTYTEMRELICEAIRSKDHAHMIAGSPADAPVEVRAAA
jgi:UDP-galactopyranose mutase